MSYNEYNNATVMLHVSRWSFTSFTSCFTVYKSHEPGMLYHVTFQEVHTHRRKEVESKHHGTVKELTSKHQRFNQD